MDKINRVEDRKFLEQLDEVSVPTRYPDQLDQLLDERFALGFGGEVYVAL